VFGTHLWGHRGKSMGLQVCGFGEWGTELWEMGVVDMGYA